MADPTRVSRLLLLSCVCFALACEAQIAPEEIEVVDAASFAEATDAWALTELAETRHEHAHAWLTEKGNALYEGDPERVQALIDSLYAAGARAVWFTGIEHVDGVATSAALAVEMPRAEAARRALLEREASWWNSPEPHPDVGQRYLGFSFDTRD